MQHGWGVLAQAMAGCLANPVASNICPCLGAH